MDLKLAFLVFFLYNGPELVDGKCEIGWSEFKEDCIYFGHDRRRWQDAENDCRRRGGWLASDDNEEKHDFIRMVLNVLRNWHFEQFYVGATDFYFEGDFRWIETGQPVGPFERWENGGPSMNTTNNCLALKWKDDTDLVWEDIRCDDGHTFYLCEKHNINGSLPSSVIG